MKGGAFLELDEDASRILEELMDMLPDTGLSTSLEVQCGQVTFTSVRSVIRDAISAALVNGKLIDLAEDGFLEVKVSSGQVYRVRTRLTAEEIACMRGEAVA